MAPVLRVSPAAVASLAGLLAGLGSCSSQSDHPASSPTDETADSGGFDVWGGGGAGHGGDTGDSSAIAVSDAGGSDAPVGDSGGSNPDASRLEAGDGSTSAEAGGACKGLFCEDFESGKLDPSIWDVQSSGGQPAAEIEDAIVAHGKHSVHFHGNPNVQSYDFIITKTAPAALGTHVFGRASFYITPMGPPGHMEFLFAGTTGFPKLKYLEVAETANTSTNPPIPEWQLTWVNTEGASNQEDYEVNAGTYPLAQWFCLEWEMNDTPDQIHVWATGLDGGMFDGVDGGRFDNISANGQTSGLVGGFGAFGFGYYDWHPASFAFDLYYDDIVLDTKRIGCL